MAFEITILGSSSASPTYNRNQSCQVVNVEQQTFLFDCGEGAQIQLLKHKFRFNRIKHILISHLHGDHYLGLFGLISSMNLQGRSSELFIYGPPGLADIITLQLKYSETYLNYPVHFKTLENSRSELIYEDDQVSLETVPLNHRIRCSGFLLKEKPKKRRLIREKLPENIRIVDLIGLKNGEDVKDEDQGIFLKNEEVTLPPKPSRSYAYCSDTIYSESIIDLVKNVDILYHEATFLSEMGDRAKHTFHSTAKDAATIASKANVQKLIIGHFSTRYKDLSPFLEEAKTIFKNTYLAIEGETFHIPEEHADETLPVGSAEITSEE